MARVSGPRLLGQGEGAAWEELATASTAPAPWLHAARCTATALEHSPHAPYHMHMRAGGAAGKAGVVTVTDDDTIEKSNLSRQFLFRDWNIGRWGRGRGAGGVAARARGLVRGGRELLVLPSFPPCCPPPASLPPILPPTVPRAQWPLMLQPPSTPPSRCGRCRWGAAHVWAKRLKWGEHHFLHAACHTATAILGCVHAVSNS